jgi:hypothetical protein
MAPTPLAWPVVALHDTHETLVEVLAPEVSDHFSGRYFSLPPPA